MTNAKFIEKYAGLLSIGEYIPLVKRHNSLMAHGNALYSYGTHYPLLIPLRGNDGRTYLLCNTAGYSSTTSKHIGYARRYADMYAPLPSGYVSIDTASVIGYMREHVAKLSDKMAAKKRKNTQVYRVLESEHNRIAGYIVTLTA